MSGKVIHYDFGYQESVKEHVAVCPKCDSAGWLLVLSNVNPGDTKVGEQRIIAYECGTCDWRVDLLRPIGVVK